MSFSFLDCILFMFVATGPILLADFFFVLLLVIICMCLYAPGALNCIFLFNQELNCNFSIPNRLAGKILCQRERAAVQVLQGS